MAFCFFQTLRSVIARTAKAWAANHFSKVSERLRSFVLSFALVRSLAHALGRSFALLQCALVLSAVLRSVGITQGPLAGWLAGWLPPILESNPDVTTVIRRDCFTAC